MYKWCTRNIQGCVRNGIQEYARVHKEYTTGLPAVWISMSVCHLPQAIALAKVMDGSLKQDDYTEYLTGFYLLKYGTPKPALQRQDSTVRNMKYHATLKEQRSRLSGKKKKRSGSGGK